MKTLQAKLERLWYRSRPGLISYLLLPLTWLFTLIVIVRRWLYRKNIKRVSQLNVPVIIVGNITVGGTGKTPLVIYLVELLRRHGYHPGVVSHGYQGNNIADQMVNTASEPRAVGDEAVLIAMRTHCPVIVGRDRATVAKQLLSQQNCNVIVSDDGLQHYALARDIEIAVLDAERGVGNGLLLPAGPLRESAKRLHEVDFTVSNGEGPIDKFMMQLYADEVYRVSNPQERKPLSAWYGKTVHAVAGIGHPQRFFQQLAAAGLNIIQQHAFPDHHTFGATELVFADVFAVIMTEKDAVKCRNFNNEKLWCLPVTARLEREFDAKFLQQVQRAIGHA